tara:strand:- start:136 stop:405 length:270 start_codon:yes stop_codon:yes gene_type:complete
MKKIAVFASIISLVSLTSVNVNVNANANAMGKPAKCPSLAVIKSVGIQHVDKAATGSDWIAWTKSNYDTNDSWTFAFPILMGKNKKTAT